MHDCRYPEVITNTITQLLPRFEDVVRREMDATWERYARLNDPESIQLDRLALLSRFTDLVVELGEVSV